MKASFARVVSVAAVFLSCLAGAAGCAREEDERNGEGESAATDISGGNRMRASGDGPSICTPPRSDKEPAAPDVAVTPSAPSQFLSADTPFYRDVTYGEEEEEEEEEEERELEEGDIYRVLGDGYLLNANPHAGLQIIDVRDPKKPEMTGRLRVSGSPVEMYVVGNRAVLLMNDWADYALIPGSIQVKPRSGGTGLLIDVADRKAPRLLAQFHVEGYIQTSRLARSSGGDSLYIASSHYGYVKKGAGYEWQMETLVTSFDVGTAAMTERGQLSLGGAVTAIHAEANALLVARDPRTWSTNDSEVTLVDISAADGTMKQRGSVRVTGHVRSQFHMDLRSNILRIFSGSRWSDGQKSRLSTFKIDGDTITPVDHRDFGKTTEQIYGAVFLDDRAFAVTYFRTDPFHAFSIDPDGKVEEKSEFIVSGWNDFFRPVLNASRLIGIGVDDGSGGRKLAVSLYDTTDLTNKKPLLARTQVADDDKGWNWSEASWDHRAFTVLDNAVDVIAPTGEHERGLVLLPFSGAWWDGTKNHAAVQIFTYSATTVTRRGIMKHPSPVRRAFRLDQQNGINLSDTALSVQDQTDVDKPTELGRLDLAPTFHAVYKFGAYRVRIVNSSSTDMRGEVIPDVGPADQVKAIAQFPLPQGRLFKVGESLVSLKSNYVEWPKTETEITVVDLTCPKIPRVHAPFITRALPPIAHIPSGGRWVEGVYPTRNALAFVRATDVPGATHKLYACTTYVGRQPSCNNGAWGPTGWTLPDCSYVTGRRTCVAIDGKTSYCAGGFARCTRAGGATTCTSEATTPPEPNVLCDGWSAKRHSSRFEVVTLDLTDPAKPVASAPVALPADEDGVGVVMDGSDLVVTTKQPAVNPADMRPYARYFARRLDLSTPTKPVVGERINVPGDVIDARGDALFTRDRVWGSQFVETALARTSVKGSLAHLTNYHAFADRYVDNIVVSDHRLALATSDHVWQPHQYYYNASDRRLTILDLAAPTEDAVPDFAVRFDGPMTLHNTHFATVFRAERQRAFVHLPGGLLMLDLRSPASPQAQAYFSGAYEPMFAGDELLVPAGPKGIYQLPIDDYLAAPEIISHRNDDSLPPKAGAKKKKYKKPSVAPVMALGK